MATTVVQGRSTRLPIVTSMAQQPWEITVVATITDDNTNHDGVQTMWGLGGLLCVRL